MEVRGAAYKRANYVNANGDSQCDGQSEKNISMSNLMYNNNSTSYNNYSSKKWRVNNNNDPLNKNGNMFATNSGGNYNNVINGKSKQRNH